MQYFSNFIKNSCVFFYNSHVHLEETFKHINAFNIRQLHTIPEHARNIREFVLYASAMPTILFPSTR